MNNGMLDSGDVMVVPIEPMPCYRCDVDNATHKVQIQIGDETVGIGGVYCKTCAIREAQSIRDALPEECPF